VREVTLWLVDLSGAAAPAPVARWTGGTGSFGASRDGKTVIVVAPGNRSVLGLHLVRPLTGEATVLFEGPADGRAFFPRLSPDGSTFAINLLNLLSGEGILIGDVATGATRTLAGTAGRGASVVPFDWSADGQWLAFFQDEVAPEGSGCCTYLENVRDGRRIRLGLATMVSWRPTEPRLLVAKQDRTGNQGAFGITTLKWNPSKDELLYVQETVGCSYHGTLWTTAVGGTAKRIGSADTVQNAWWSSDGLTIYALVRGDGPDSPVIDASSGRRIAVIPNDAPRACP
jgi:dipeptidyl aminopeptidase/acylaminoacyl peptidase